MFRGYVSGVCFATQVVDTFIIFPFSEVYARSRMAGQVSREALKKKFLVNLCYCHKKHASGYMKDKNHIATCF